MKQPVPQAEAASRPRILVVDDESSMREMLRIVLRRDGYEVVLASSGNEAIQQLQTATFDLLLSDIRMPDTSGVEVLREARQIDSNIVAFMMTAYASTESAVEAMRLGAADYFIKPFSMDELRLKVRQHLEARQLREENLLLKRALNTRYEFSNILGVSDAMQHVFATIRSISRIDDSSSTTRIRGRLAASA